nr:hypothetical protein GCM10020093_051280 [Planobispora longispora]
MVTIPENFSAAVTSTSREDGTRAEQAVLRVRSDDAHNYIAGTLARSVGAAATASLNAQVTETYLDNVYIGFTALHEEIGEAAEERPTWPTAPGSWPPAPRGPTRAPEISSWGSGSWPPGPPG